MDPEKLQFVLGTFLITSILSVTNASFTPSDNYLIVCGSPSNTTVGQRLFVSDADASLPSSATLNAPRSIPANTTASSVSSFDSSELYRTARIFTAPSSYSFPIRTHGRHFVRLYFYPFTYREFDLAAATFSVSTQDAVLLDHFHPTSNSSPVFKEYLLNITRDTLVLSFAPNSNLAFVNSLEVVSAPDSLIIDDAETINPLGQYQGLSSQSLETYHRINMGAPKVDPDYDTLWRTWVPDQNFTVDSNLTNPVSFSGKLNHMEGLATEESAPDLVYSTARQLAESTNNTMNALFNMTWQFDVDAGYSYLIRFHFCDIVSTAAHQLYFNVYVGSWVVSQDLDLSTLTYNSLAVPYFMDFVLSAKDASSKITVSIGPSTMTNVSPDGILNGLEIMKIGSNSGSNTKPARSKTGLGVLLGGSVAGAGALVITASVAFGLLRRRRKNLEKQSSKSWTPFSAPGSSRVTAIGGTSNAAGAASTLGQNGGGGGAFGYRLPFMVLQEATNNFDDSQVIGVGGFGKVYEGVLRDDTRVAVKRGNPRSHQGINEFRTEIELLSRLRHRHLVSLIGFCDERSEMILVYEHMAKGTLKSHLYGSDHPPLSWKQRLDICIGSARGLHYLHTGSAKAIIHRDVKSANILLDENLMAKVADFGLSKTGPELDQTHVSTAVKGSFGYLDPEYFRRQMLTEKSDVYSFGVVLLEVLCARPVIDPTLPREMVNLAEWGMKWLQRGELDRIVDRQISGAIRPESLRKFAETVEKCLADCGAERPAMGDVLWNLEYALQLQEAGVDNSGGINSINLIAGFSSSHARNGSDAESNEAREEAGAGNLDDLPNVSMRRVFSQLIKAEGR